jgi:putative aldouronate transport system substrate-binding protein
MGHSGSGYGKTIFAGLIAAVMIVPLAGCGSNKSAAIDANGKPIVNIMVRRNAIDIHMKDMSYTKELEAACNCTIKWSEVTDNAWSNQKAAKMAAGDFPDISLTLYDPTDVSRYPSEFLDFSKHLNRLPNVKKFFAARPVAKKMAMDDGHIYILPSDRGKGYRVSATHMFINKTWLDRLGLAMPTTWDQLENVLQKFKTDDPNGDGKHDEIPMNVRGLGFGLWSPFTLLNSTGVATSFMGSSASSQGYYVENGKVKSYMTSDKLKAVIAYLHKLVAEGLIPRDFLTRDASQYDAQTINDAKTALTGVSFGWSNNSEFGNLGDQYVTIPPLKQDASTPDSDVKWDYSSDATEYAYSLAVNPKAPNLDSVYKIVNAMYSERLSVEGYFGSIPDIVASNGNHQYTIDKKKAYAKYTDTRGVALQDRFAGWIPDSVKMVNDTNADYVTASNKACEPALSHVDPVKDVIPIYVRPNSSDMDTLSNNNTAISNYVNNQYAKWVVNGGVEKEWNSYLGKLQNKSLGLNQNIAIWQKWYDRQTK